MLFHNIVLITNLVFKFDILEIVHMYLQLEFLAKTKCVSSKEIGVPSVFTFVESWQLIASGIRTKETGELCPFAS